MALDLKAWLNDMGITDQAVIDQLTPALTPVAGKIEEGVLRQSDYSRKSAELQTKQAAFDTANERLNAEMVEWAETQNAGGQITEKMRRDMAAAQGEVTRLKTIITTKATELGIDAKTIIGDDPVVVVPPTNPGPGTGDPDPRYMRPEQFGAAADLLLTLPAELQQIASEHFELTGQRIDVRPLVQEFKARAALKRADPARPLDIRQIWESTHGIQAKRDERTTATRATELAEAETRGYQRARTEATVPGASPTGHHSPVLVNRGEPKAQRPSTAGKQDTISKAASALATHKYAGYRGDRHNPAAGGGT